MYISCVHYALVEVQRRHGDQIFISRQRLLSVQTIRLIRYVLLLRVYFYFNTIYCMFISILFVCYDGLTSSAELCRRSATSSSRRNSTDPISHRLQRHLSVCYSASVRNSQRTIFYSTNSTRQQSNSPAA